MPSSFFFTALFTPSSPGKKWASILSKNTQEINLFGFYWFFFFDWSVNYFYSDVLELYIFVIYIISFVSSHIFRSFWLTSNVLSFKLSLRCTIPDILTELFSVLMFLASSTIDVAIIFGLVLELNRLFPRVLLLGPGCLLSCIVWRSPSYTWLLQMNSFELTFADEN